MPKGYPVDPVTASARKSAALRGQPKSAEWRAKMSAIRTGRPLSPEHRAAMMGIRKSLEHRDKLAAASAGKTLSPEVRANLSARARGNTYVRDAPVLGECAYCLGPATQHDHVIPRGRPGWRDPDNLVLACARCNSWKRNRTPEEWFAAMS